MARAMDKKAQHTWKEKKEKEKKKISILVSFETMCYLKSPFLGDEQEQDVIFGMLSDRISETPAIGAVLELSVAGKDLQVKLAARPAYSKQSEDMFATSCQADSPSKWIKFNNTNHILSQRNHR